MLYGLDNPMETKPIAYDWKGLELYGGEEGFWIDGEFVLEEDAQEFLEEEYGLTEIGEQ